MLVQAQRPTFPRQASDGYLKMNEKILHLSAFLTPSDSPGFLSYTGPSPLRRSLVVDEAPRGYPLLAEQNEQGKFKLSRAFS